MSRTFQFHSIKSMQYYVRFLEKEAPSDWMWTIDADAMTVTILEPLLEDQYFTDTALAFGGEQE